MTPRRWAVAIVALTALAVVPLTAWSAVRAGPAGVTGVWHGQTVLFPGTPAIPVTATFHRDGTFSVSTIVEVQPNPLLPGAKSPVQGTWGARAGEVTGVGVWFDEGTGGGSPADVPAIGRVVIAARLADRDHMTGQALVEIMACTSLVSCPDPTAGVPDPPLRTGETFSLTRLRVPD
jgi:hypothetical protein